MTITRLGLIFGFLSTLPFVALGFAPWFGGLMPAPMQDQLLLVVYSAVILAFLGGNFWRQSRATKTPCPWLMSFSVLIAMAPFAAIMLTFFIPVKASLIYGWLFIWFVAAAGMEWQLWQRKQETYDYFKMRAVLTLIMLASLIAAILAPVQS